ncbi:MAG: HAD family phosphatase [Bacteroides sp.]|nr:HAD family phosphatase [Eubacterium sp.]MCM1419277.1 HAD family phosphatase [Roseburia sp.]MCM1463139.1 HAD family phosphatase [Bacteroides sp.]
MRVKAVLFDMDGTILDTEKLLVRYWCEAANEAGYPMRREHALALRSLAGAYAEPLLKEWFGEDCSYRVLRARRMELMAAHIEKYGIEVKPGFPALLSALGERGLYRAVVTATDLERAERYLTKVGLYDEFDDVISVHMVKNGKPKPDVYLYAAERLGLLPGDCIAVEDSPNGVRSASAAGCHTVMIPDLSEPEEELIPLLTAVCKTPGELLTVLKREEAAGAAPSTKKETNGGRIV